MNKCRHVKSPQDLEEKTYTQDFVLEGKRYGGFFCKKCHSLITATLYGENEGAET
jgi:hypothetical protein